jgi:PAS domain S-box-containing protein
MPLSNPLSDIRFVQGIRATRYHPVSGYGIAVAVVAVAIVLRYALDPWLSEVGVPYITFYPAILLATFLGGLGPGLTSLALCTLVAWYIFLPPAFTFELSPQQVFSLVLFVVLGGFDVLLITLLNSALDRIVTHEANIRTLIDAAPNGIVVVDGQGDITLVNPAAEKMFGYTQAQLFGQKIEILVPEPKRNGHGKLREDYMRAPVQRPMGLGRDFQAECKDGTAFPVEVDLAPIQGTGGTGVMATVVDISRRKQAEDRQRLLVGELRHRAQNILSVVQAVAHRTLSACPPSEKTDLLGRLHALGRVNAMLADGNWEAATLHEIVARELAVFSTRVEITGCDIAISSSVAQNFALVVHELATNAAKYGALSNRGGQVVVRGKTELVDEGRDFLFEWIESSGPEVKPPQRKGFGTSVLVDVAQQFGRDIKMSFEPGGLRYSLRASLSAIQATAVRAN